MFLKQANWSVLKRLKRYEGAVLREDEVQANVHAEWLRDRPVPTFCEERGPSEKRIRLTLGHWHLVQCMQLM